MITVMVNWPFAPDMRERLRAGVAKDVRLVFVEDEEAARREIANAEILLGELTPALFPLAERLKWVQLPLAGLEGRLFPEFIDSDILLTSAAGIYNEPIADHIYALLLALTRDIPALLRAQARRHWLDRSELEREPQVLAGKTLGIVGLGGIGAEVASRAPAYGMRVVATRAHPERPKPVGVDQVWGPDGLPRLLALSDIVAICTPETPHTKGMIGAQELAQMKPSAYLLNVGRGSAVDLLALTRALESGALAGAALDVFETEPLPADHPLWSAERVIISPHLSYLPDSKYPKRRIDVFLENLCRYLEGRPLRNLVDKKNWH